MTDPDPIQALARAIAQVESGGRYDARGPVIPSGQYRGQRALGKYQIMPGNLPEWSRAALGREVSVDEFLKNPQLQERIATDRMSRLYDQYGNPRDVASAWHSGRPLSQAGNARDVNMSTRQYVDRVSGLLSNQQQAPRMNELERLERALRAAHAAGDATAAQRFAAEIRRVQGSAPAPTAPKADFSAVQSGSSTGPAEISPREIGRQSVQGRDQTQPGAQLAAAAQGFGSGFFGLGTPVTAAAEFAARALPGGEPAVSPGAALEIARGIREGSREENPGAFYTGMAGSIVGGVGAVRAGARALPKVATVFTPQAGQTARNVAKISGAGATAAGVTAAAEQGTEGILPAAATGAVAAPAFAGGVHLGSGALSRAASVINKDHAAIKIIAKNLGETAEELSDRWNAFRDRMGRAPSIAEISSRELSEEFGQVSRLRSGAGSVFRQAEEEAALALPRRLSGVVRNNQPISSIPAQQGKMEAVTESARELVNRRSASTAAAQIGRRDVRMDELMGQIGNQRVPITDDMLEVIQHPDVWNTLDPALRRRIGAIIEQGQQIGSVDLSVRSWDAIRQELANKSGSGAGQIYARLRDKVRDYVGGAVPEYSAGLREFGRRTDVAAGTEIGSRVVRDATRDFIDALRTAGGGTAEKAQRSGTRASVQVGSRSGVRLRLQEELGSSAEKAERFMRRLAGDRGLRARIRESLSDREATELEGLAQQYGVELDFSKGLKTGQRVLTSKTDPFREAVAQAAANPTTRKGIEVGVRSEISDVALESPEHAARVGKQLAEGTGLQNRLEFAMGGDEAQRLREVGKFTTTASRRLAAASPGATTAAQTAAREAAETVKSVIEAGVIASGRWSGAFLGHFLNNLVRRLSLTEATAEKLARMATDPKQAEAVIERLIAAGVKPNEIGRMYRDAAVASGILSGRE